MLHFVGTSFAWICGFLQQIHCFALPPTIHLCTSTAAAFVCHATAKECRTVSFVRWKGKADLFLFIEKMAWSLAWNGNRCRTLFGKRIALMVEFGYIFVSVNKPINPTPIRSVFISRQRRLLSKCAHVLLAQFAGARSRCRSCLFCVISF